MIDVKKLITGFLILAVATGASALLISTIGGSSTSVSASSPQVIVDATATSSPSISENAFVAQPEAQIADVTAETGGTSTSLPLPDDDSNNMTDALADSYLNGVILTNPNGPVADANGDPILTPPDPASVASVVANATATQTMQIPDWDAEAASQPIRIAANSTPTSITAYNTALNDVMTAHFNGQVESILNNPDTADTNDLAYVGAQMQQALGDTLALETPPSLVHFQKDFVKILVYDKNFFQLLTLAQTDPVKASLVFQDEDSSFQLAQQEFQKDSQEIVSGSVSLQNDPSSPNPIVAMVDNVLGIQTVHAQWAVFDAATWNLIYANQLQNIEKQLEATLKNTLLQILKNTLIALIQRKVLAYIQGSGAPRFITNWSTQLITAYEQNALNAINSAFSCSYAGFAPQLKLTLKVGYNSQGSSCANTFATALGGNSLQQFQNNFKSGSWLAFSAGSMPTNNYYGSLFFGAQIVDYNGQNAQKASQAQSIASQGAKGDTKCDDGSDPNNGEHTVCENPDGQDYTIQGSEQCGPGDTPVVYANQGTCSDGTQPQVTTPGIFTVSTANSGIDATSKQVAAANDIVGLLNAVTGSLITGLANAAVTAAGNTVNGILSVSPSSIQGGGTPPPPAPLACAPSSQTVQVIASTTPPGTISASGGTPDQSGNFPTYNWASSDGATSTGQVFSHAYTIAGTYNVMLSDSSGDASTTCTVIVQ